MFLPDLVIYFGGYDFWGRHIFFKNLGHTLSSILSLPALGSYTILKVVAHLAISSRLNTKIH